MLNLRLADVSLPWLLTILWGITVTTTHSASYSVRNPTTTWHASAQRAGTFFVAGLGLVITTTVFAMAVIMVLIVSVLWLREMVISGNFARLVRALFGPVYIPAAFMPAPAIPAAPAPIILPAPAPVVDLVAPAEPLVPPAIPVAPAAPAPIVRPAPAPAAIAPIRPPMERGIFHITVIMRQAQPLTQDLDLATIEVPANPIARLSGSRLVSCRPITIPGEITRVPQQLFAVHYAANEQLFRQIPIRLGRVRPQPTQSIDQIPPLIIPGRATPPQDRSHTFNHIVRMFTKYNWIQVRPDQWSTLMGQLSNSPQRVFVGHCNVVEGNAAIVLPALSFKCPLLQAFADRGLVLDLNLEGSLFEYTTDPRPGRSPRIYRPIRFVRPSTIRPSHLALLAPVALTADLPFAVPPFPNFTRVRVATGQTVEGFPRCPWPSPDRPAAALQLVFSRFEAIEQYYAAMHNRNACAVWPVQHGRNPVYELFTSDRMDLYRIQLAATDQPIRPYAPGYCPTYNWGNHMIPGSLGWLDPQVAQVDSGDIVPGRTVQNIRLPHCEPLTLRQRYHAKAVPISQYENIQVPNGVRGTINESISTQRYYQSVRRVRARTIRYMRVDPAYGGARFADAPSGDLLQEIAMMARAHGTRLAAALQGRTPRQVQQHLAQLAPRQTITGTRMTYQALSARIRGFANTLRGNVLPRCTLIGAAYPPAVIPVQFAHLDRAPGVCKLLFLVVPPQPLNRRIAPPSRFQSLTIEGAQHLRNYVGNAALYDSLAQLYGSRAARGGRHIDNHQVTLAISNMTPPEIMPRFPTDIVGPVPTLGDYLLYRRQRLARHGLLNELFTRQMYPSGAVTMQTYSQFFNVPYSSQVYTQMIAAGLIRRADRVYTSNGALLTFSIPIDLINPRFHAFVNAIKAMPDAARKRFGRVSISRRNTADGPLVLHCAIPMSASMYVIPFTKMIPQGILLPVNGTPEERARVEHDRVYNAMMAQHAAEVRRTDAPDVHNFHAGVAAIINTTTWRSDMPNDVLTGQAPGTLLMHSGLPRILNQHRRSYELARQYIWVARLAQNAHPGLWEPRALPTQQIPANARAPRLEMQPNESIIEPTITPQTCRASVQAISKLRCRSGQPDIANNHQQGATNDYPFSDLYGSVKVIDMAAANTRLQPTTEGFGTEVDPLARCLPQIVSDSEEAADFEAHALAIVQLLNDVMTRQNSDAYKQVVSNARISLPLCIVIARPRTQAAEARANMLEVVAIDPESVWPGRVRLTDTHTTFRQGCLVGPGGLKRLLHRHNNELVVTTHVEEPGDVCTTNPLVFTGAVDMLIQQDPTGR